jgi:hypothetical protein
MVTHITWMQFALHAPDSKLRKDDLMVVVKNEIKQINCCVWLKTRNYFVVF